MKNTIEEYSYYNFKEEKKQQYLLQCYVQWCFFLQVILSVLFIVVTITHDVCSRRRIPPLCLVRCASLWLGCEYDCRSEYLFISLIHPTVMETCTHNCEQQRLTCMQHSLDPICRTTARDMTLYAAFQKKANGTVSAATPSLNGPQGR